MGALKQGDAIFDGNGQVCRVVAATEIMYGRPCNRVVFSDGSEIVADDDHRWLTWLHCERKNAARNGRKSGAGAKKPIVNATPKVRTTAEIAATLCVNSRGDRNHSIPCAGALDLPDAELPIPPYVLGAWLGDGTSASGGFTCHPDDAQIIEEIRTEGQPVQKSACDPIGWCLSAGRFKRGTGEPFVVLARRLGVVRDKHIPAIYLRASEGQRLALLQGLMDTDGTTNASGRCEFCSCNRRLAEGVRELALTLGVRATLFEGKASIGGKDCGPKYRVKFTTSRPVFRLRRKAERLSGRRKRYNVEQRLVTEIVPIKSVPVRCIAVDSDSKLYLAGKAFIPTHNTDLAKTIVCDGATKGRSYGWFSPEYKFQSEAYSEIADVLAPVKKSASRIEGVYRTVTGGRIDFWSLDNERAGRSRKYHGVVIDEAAFGKANLMRVWQLAIKPTLLDYGGWAIALSNTNGIDSENFFWRICKEPEHGFLEHHAPTHDNPFLPPDELERLERDNHPLVFRQEYLAEFVDWSGAVFFALDSLLVPNAEGGHDPIADPDRCDYVAAVIDTAVKTGSANDGTGIVYIAIDKVQRRLGHPPLRILDWDIQQIEGALLETWLPTVFQNLEHYAELCGARYGSGGVWIEDKSSGMVLLQQAQRRGWPAQPIESALTSVGKDERAISVSGYVYRGEVKLTERAFNKIVTYKDVTRNHLLSQVTGFRVGDKDARTRQDDLLDAFCYSIALSLGDSGAF